MKKCVGFLGNYYKIPEYIYHSDDFEIGVVVVEKDRVTNELLTFLLVRNIKYITVETKEELVEVIESSGIQLWITCAYGKRIPMEKLPQIEMYNFHFAELPAYRGRHPNFWAILNNEKSLGVTLHRVTQRIDEGDIVSQRNVPLYLWLNELEGFEKLAEHVPEMLKDLSSFLDGKEKSVPNGEGVYYPIVKEEDYTIDLEKDEFDIIFNKVRAQFRYRGAKIVLNQKTVWIKHFWFSSDSSEEKGILVIPVRDSICMRIDNYIIEE